MTIEPISNGNLRIWLAEDEIEEWGLTDRHPSGVRRLVRRALSAAGRRPTSRMWAEMIPVEGGCVVLVSTEIHRRTQPAVYAIEAPVLTDIVARLRMPTGDTAQVYAMENGYHIVVYSERESSDAMLREYGQPLGCGEGLAAHTAEYGRWLFTLPEPEPPAPEGQKQ